MKFKEWLINEKKYNNRVAQDIVSRTNRAKNILQIDNIDNNIEEKLNQNDDFKKLSPSVRSQIRISLRLYLEYRGENND